MGVDLDLGLYVDFDGLEDSSFSSLEYAEQFLVLLRGGLELLDSIWGPAKFFVVLLHAAAVVADSLCVCADAPKILFLVFLN